MEKVGILVLNGASVILSLLLNTNLFNSGTTGLNSRKMDNHIEKLMLLPWFNELYESERHHRILFCEVASKKIFTKFNSYSDS